jgi:hypothetical protein
MEIEVRETRRTVGGLTATYWMRVYNPRIGQYVYFRELAEAVDWIYSVNIG